MVDDSDINEYRTITGVEQENLIVEGGQQLTLLGTAHGSVHVREGGRLYLGGVEAGALSVDLGGEAVIRGRLDGGIAHNDGDILVAEGAFIGDLVMGASGLEHPRSGTTYTVTDKTPVHRVAGVGRSITLA
ncbi:hypothetical protein E9228_002780 [Curtobacterium flaccumfaciens]|uniref:Polymer-forming cytoskeletal protein n=1 Tax=Curtobacterium salicis TaxID=1779862 RepID=A0ABX0T9D4_9MICO|nr:hypothetical protein [Curtobacterium sp. WW7]NII42122.1 hypothetical protein [Curtobacterium sp. WW7]